MVSFISLTLLKRSFVFTKTFDDRAYIILFYRRGIHLIIAFLLEALALNWEADTTAKAVRCLKKI